jgi:signal transduction histidine kinase
LLHPLPATTSAPGGLWVVEGPPRRVLRRFSDQVPDAGGAPLGEIEVFTDVTALEETNQIKDEFIAAAAHDLKTPVSAVKGFAQMALRLARRTDEHRLIQQLEIINTRSDHLAYLMDSLLDISRIQGGRLHLDLEDVVVNDLIMKVVRHFDYELQRQGRRVDVDVPEQPLVARWDAGRMERVLINLIGNAIKYSPNGRFVHLRVQELPRSSTRPVDMIELRVTDHGIGIPADQRELIFERSYRVPETISDGFKGTGLGLYICSRVVQAHQGHISAEAADHGEPGTTMRVVIPRQVDADPA